MLKENKIMIKLVFAILLFSVLFFFAVAAQGSTLTGTVIRVSDGDTIKVLDENNIRHNIRLAGIDAPERGQPFSNQSRLKLSTLVYRKQVSIEVGALDRFGRTVGKVTLGGQDVNLKLVQAGLAWHYVRFANLQTESDRQAYRQAQLSAQQQRVGIWSHPSPVPPWDFRRNN